MLSSQDMRMTSTSDTDCIVGNEVVPDGSSVNHSTAKDEKNTDGEAASFGRTGGLTVVTTTVFIVGEMAGSGVLALPHAMVNAGWIGLVLLVVCCFLSGYSGVNLGTCWTILQERWPEYRGPVRYPYPAIAERAFGKPMRYVVSLAVDMTLFGVGTVFLLLAAQNVQHLFEQAGVCVSSCYWLLIMTAVLIPASWLGTPKDFWPLAVGASAATFLACLFITINTAMDDASGYSRKDGPVTHSAPGFESFFLAFGAILFSFGGASTFPTIQNDMKTPKDFYKVVIVGYLIILGMYLPVSASGYFVYGDDVKPNVLLSISPGGISVTVEILITLHLLLAFVIAINPLAQELEEVFKVPKKFHWSRCVLRTIIVLCILFVAESIPHFGAILDLIGGSTVSFLTFVAPPLFYLKLSSQKGDWPERTVPLHIKVLNIEIILIGIVGGIASTYSAVKEIVSPSTFIPPCYINITAASAMSQFCMGNQTNANFTMH